MFSFYQLHISTHCTIQQIHVQLPSGKKVFVFNAKRDQDGELEPVVCFLDRNNKRLMWLNKEELNEFEKLEHWYTIEPELVRMQLK
ncbi:hypothetical protein IE077_000070, partial [Cardiosporidium cionae]